MPEDSDQIHETPPAEPQEAEQSTTVADPEIKAAPPRTDRLPPFKVLLHNDDVNDFEHVIRTVLRLTPLSTEEAVERTFEAHNSGVSLLLVTHRERAELYCEQFAGCSLLVTAEAES